MRSYTNNVNFIKPKVLATLKIRDFFFLNNRKYDTSYSISYFHIKPV